MSYPQPYLYQSDVQTTQTTKAVLVLPEIFGVNAHIRSVADRFAQECNLPAFALDFFYDLTGEPNDFAYDEEGMNKGVALMHKTTGEVFDAIYSKGIAALHEALPEVQHIIVIGFCMGGRLAFAAGKHVAVQTILSLYGARANVPLYADGTNALEALINARGGDASLRIYGFFGETDQSIHEEDRALTAKTLQDAGIHYEQHLFTAGHAFFNDARPNFIPQAAAEAWDIIKQYV